MTTLDEIKKYFIERCNEIISLANRGDAWIFLCGAAMIDYLTQMVTAKSGRLAYIDFVNQYFVKINSNYRDFSFQNGQKDLPTQMYLILRCGIVHKFSFVPDRQQEAKGGRSRTILLAHEMNGYVHLTAYTKKGIEGIDGVVFTAEQFSKDIKQVVELIFTNVEKDRTLENNVLNHIKNYPPILGQF